MRKAHLFLLLVCALSLLTFVPNARTAPIPGDKPTKYEYAELTFHRGVGPWVREQMRGVVSQAAGSPDPAPEGEGDPLRCPRP